MNAKLSMAATALAACWFASAAALNATSMDHGVEIVISEGRYRITANNVNLSILLQEIKEKTGVTFYAGDEMLEDRVVSGSIDAASLEEMARRFFALMGLNTASVYDQGGAIRECHLFSHQSASKGGDFTLANEKRPPMGKRSADNSVTETSMSGQFPERKLPEGMATTPSVRPASGAKANKPLDPTLPEGMVIHPADQSLPDGMVINPSDQSVPEGMVINPSDETLPDGMLIQPADNSVPTGMIPNPANSTPTEGMVVHPSDRPAP